VKWALKMAVPGTTFPSLSTTPPRVKMRPIFHREWYAVPQLNHPFVDPGTVVLLHYAMCNLPPLTDVSLGREDFSFASAEEEL
jgi:hypothetical protein